MIHKTDPFLSSEGEMGQLIQNFDWSATSLGPIASWPPSLRTVLNMILRNSNPMFIWWGPELIQFYNDAYRVSLGDNGKHPAALGQRGEDCWPDIWPIIYPLIRRVLDHGESPKFDDTIIPIYRNGSVENVYWSFSYSPITGDDGSTIGILSVCMDNTQKIRQLKLIEEREDQLSFAIDAAELATWDYNPKTNHFFSNQRLRKWFGLGPGDDIDLALAIEAIIPSDRTMVTQAIQQALQFGSGGRYDIKYTIRNKLTQQERIVRAKGKASFGEDQIAYRFNGTLQDITDIETSHIQVINAEEKMRLAVVSADLGTYELDLVTDQITTSARFNEIWGISAGAVTHDALIERVNPQDRPIGILANEIALETGRLDYQTRIRYDDGRQHWVRVLGSVIYNEQQEPVVLTGVVQDINEQKQFEQALTEQVAERTTELHRSNQDLLQFAHVITHDLKEPVRKIKVFTNRLLHESLDPLKETAILNKTLLAAGRMSSMIDGVLRYSEFTAMQAEPEPVDLNNELTHIREDLEVMIEERGAQLHTSALPIVNGIPILLHQLFYNLINNALKFSRPGQPPQIYITATPITTYNQSWTQISITDNGIGFDAKYAGTIFESFIRLHSKDRFEGTGLGLALCKKIVERHGGKISADSVPGSGAIFTFTLPVSHIPEQS